MIVPPFPTCSVRKIPVLKPCIQILKTQDSPKSCESEGKTHSFLLEDSFDGESLVACEADIPMLRNLVPLFAVLFSQFRSLPIGMSCRSSKCDTHWTHAGWTWTRRPSPRPRRARRRSGSRCVSPDVCPCAARNSRPRRSCASTTSLRSTASSAAEAGMPVKQAVGVLSVVRVSHRVG